MLIVQMDLNLASDRRGLTAVSLKDILEHHVHVAVGQCFVAVGSFAVVADVDEAVQGMGPARLRFLGHRPCRFAHRTPALYSRIKSRTTKFYTKKERRGRDNLPSCSK